MTVCGDAEAVARTAAERMVHAVQAARAQRGVAHIALAGGTSPRRAYELFSALIEDWQGIHLWFGDERAVGADDPLANYGMASSALPPACLHRIAGERGADAAAAAYADELATTVVVHDGGLPALDLAVLGLGQDGHTASLFPGSPALDADGVCVAVVDAPMPPPDRITLTLPMLRAASARLIVAGGDAKSGPVAALLAGPDPAVPASLVGPRATELLIDEAAAAQVSPPAAAVGAAGRSVTSPRMSARSSGAVDDPEASDEEIQLIAPHRILSSDDPAGMLASLVRISEDERVQELHEDLLAGRFRRDPLLRGSGRS